MSRFLPSRRLLMRGAAGVVALGAAGAGASVLACRDRSEPERADGAGAPPLGRLFVALGEIPEAETVGHAVCASCAGPVAAAVAAHAGLARAAAIACDATRLAELRAVFTEDFHAGRTRVVEGWVLSEAECLTAGLRAEAEGAAPDRPGASAA